jgi:hypothetical protein
MVNKHIFSAANVNCFKNTIYNPLLETLYQVLESDVAGRH